MSEPKVAEKKPAVLELEAGTYYWCSCGHSAKQPFCDGAHKTTGFVPLKFELVEKAKKAMCQCKQTATKPYCDGAHTKV
jgi:CDGSH-type Zn-finger protein